MPGPLSHLTDWPRGDKTVVCAGCGSRLDVEVSRDRRGARFVCGAPDSCGWTGPWGERTWEGRRMDRPIDAGDGPPEPGRPPREER